MGKSLSNTYGQKILDSAKKSRTDAITTASKRAIQKTAEVTGDLTGNKFADKITSVPKKCRCRNSYSYEKIHIPRRKKTNCWRIKITTQKVCIN